MTNPEVDPYATLPLAMATPARAQHASRRRNGLILGALALVLGVGFALLLFSYTVSSDRMLHPRNEELLPMLAGLAAAAYVIHLPNLDTAHPR